MGTFLSIMRVILITVSIICVIICYAACVVSGRSNRKGDD